MFITENLIPISPQEAKDRKLFGPVYHGSTSDKLKKINIQGFKVSVGYEKQGDVSHGYGISDYWGGIPAPIHHLGFGVYFTTVKAIAKQFSYDNPKIGPYFLDVPNLLTINFGSPRTMMKWWQENGYDFNYDVAYPDEDTTVYSQHNIENIRRERLRATLNLTNHLKSKYDGVWFKGKNIRRLLDGDQVVVFDPNRVYKLDKSLIKVGEIGSKIISKVGIDPYGRGEITIPIGTKGIIIDKKKPTEFQKWAEGSEWLYSIKWEPGGVMRNVIDQWIEPYTRRKQLEENIIYRRRFWKDYENIIKEGDEDHADALQKTGYWGIQGAGAIILAKSTGRILLPFRSRYVEQPHTWGVWGGAIDENEDPATAVKREIHEEVGYAGPIQLMPMYVFEDPRVGFRYSNFLAVVPDEFQPHKQWETERSEWIEFGKWPTPLHFGLKAFLQHSGNEILQNVKKYIK